MNNRLSNSLGDIWKKVETFWKKPQIKYLIAPILLFLALSYICIWQSHGAGNLIPIMQHIGRFGLPYCIIAIGTGLVISAGGMDISSMGVAALSGVLLAVMYKLGFGLFGATLLAVMVGIISGCIIGLLTTKLYSPPMILTWAWGLGLSVFAILLSTGQVVDFPDADRLVTTITTNAVNYKHVFLIYALFGILFIGNRLRFSGIIRRACAIGANRDAAIYSGIRADGTIIWTYIINGLCASLFGIMWFFFNSGNIGATDFVGQDLIPIAIALLGGTALNGGYYKLFPIFCAGIFWESLGLIKTGVDTSSLPSSIQPYITQWIFSGVIIFVCIVFGKKLQGETITIHREQNKLK